MKSLLLLFATLTLANHGHAAAFSLERCQQTALSSQDQLHCLDLATREEDWRLNLAYRAARASIQPSRRKVLRDVQRLWIKYRDAKCGFYYHPQSGRGGLLDLQQCLLDETRQRRRELEALGSR